MLVSRMKFRLDLALFNENKFLNFLTPSTKKMFFGSFFFFKNNDDFNRSLWIKSNLFYTSEHLTSLGTRIRHSIEWKINFLTFTIIIRIRGTFFLRHRSKTKTFILKLCKNDRKIIDGIEMDEMYTKIRQPIHFEHKNII